MSLRDEILAVMRDGSRIDRFLEITCVDDPPCNLFLTTKNTAVVQFAVPVCDGETEGDEEEAADAVISEAREFLMENA
jgi:hypothetical protein